jgi:hypothetical protein
MVDLPRRWLASAQPDCAGTYVFKPTAQAKWKFPNGCAAIARMRIRIVNNPVYPARMPDAGRGSQDMVVAAC